MGEQDRQDHIGTHYRDCWKHHPDCAYWAAREQVARELDSLAALIEDENQREAVAVCAAVARGDAS